MKRDFKITKDYIETHFGHDNVKTITLPASTTQIEEYAFFDCASIETLDLSGSPVKVCGLGIDLH